MVVNNLRVRLHCGTFSPVKWTLFQWIKENHISCHIVWEECRFLKNTMSLRVWLLHGWGANISRVNVLPLVAGTYCSRLNIWFDFTLGLHLSKTTYFKRQLVLHYFHFIIHHISDVKYTLKTYKVIKDNIKIKPMVFNLCCL